MYLLSICIFSLEKYLSRLFIFNWVVICIVVLSELFIYTWLSLFSHSVMSDSLWPHGLQHTVFLCAWHSPGKNTGVGCHALLQGIFPTQGSNQHLLRLLTCRQVLYHWASREAQTTDSLHQKAASELTLDSL